MPSTCQHTRGSKDPIANTTIKCSKSQKLLGIVFGNKIKFDKHAQNICQRASKK